MYAIAISLLGAMLTAWYFAAAEPQRLNIYQATAADVAAANFWSYWLVVNNYEYYYPCAPLATCTLPDASLTFQLGYVRNPAWKNVVVEGQVYVYAPTPAVLPAGTATAIAARGRFTRVIGIALTNGTLTDFVTGAVSETPLPLSIPAGAIVVVGN